jgi:serine protease Do
MSIRGLGEVAERMRRYTVLLQPAGGRGNGSGVLWDPSGLVVTNAHVARGAQALVMLWDGREVEARVEARDPRRDLAALRVNADGLAAAIIGDSSRVRAGEVAIAVGNPWGFLGAMTVGVVQAVGALHGLGARPWVQSDVILAPGNSGGPLADANGRVIGINTMVAGRVALAIPSNEVSRFLSGEASDARLGLTIERVRLPQPHPWAFGLLALEVQPDSPAAMASLLPGDILLGTEDRTFRSVSDLKDALDETSAEVLPLRFLRGDYRKVRRVSVSLKRGRRSSLAA